MIKPLKAMAYLPFATVEGSMVTTPGYDPTTNIFAEFAGEELRAIPAMPSKKELAAALQTAFLPWKGYRFATDNDNAAMLSAIITTVCRPALTVSPAFFVDAPVQGSGKTKCAAALAALASGKRGGITPFVDGAGVEAETVKKLVAMSLSGEPFWLIDNVVGTWRSPVIASLITDGVLSERLLGGNSWYRGEARMTICATGNNASLDHDLGRRFIIVRIDSGSEAPQSRCFDFDPVDKALAMRMEIATAVLVLIQGFRAAQVEMRGRGDAGFSEWNRLVRQCVLWLGEAGVAAAAGIGPLGDPAHSIMHGAVAGDPESGAHQMFMTGLFEAYLGKTFQAKDVRREWEKGDGKDTDVPEGMIREGLTALLRLPPNVMPTAISVGKVLQHRRDKPINGMCFRQVGTDRNGTANWMVAAAGGAGGAGS
jgi:putative DNA primase/helicase